ncbi:DUF418 domain-containing protein [Nocardia callitridis]|uniref:DUF418 domain-containing protein n=1 Tax=Nocardia callitridis TaxID=648753 RepID=A0ABP9K7G7_9NOCA
MTESIAASGSDADRETRRGAHDGPPSAPTRLIALDVLRGIAILGTLATNVWILTNAEGLVGYLSQVSATGSGWAWVERVLQQLVQGKFLGLLTVMFGIGLAIQQGSATRGGRRWPGKYPVRAGLLLLDGTLNFLFVAEYDVLMGYAVTGLVVAYLLARSERAQRRWLVVTASIHVAILTLIAVALAMQPKTDRPRGGPLRPNPYAEGSFWDLVVFRAQHVAIFRLETVFIFAMSIALFLVGARLYRAGVFRPEGALLRRRLMMIGFGIAAPIDLIAGIAGGGDMILFTRYGTAPFVSLGILALGASWYLRRPHPGFVGRRLTEVGRTALSCYILQNLVASTLCYGWGFGLASRVSPDTPDTYVAFTVGVFLTTSALIMLAAHLWLRRFARGPVEWLWHTSYRAVTRER